jgi:protein TonB
MSFVQPHRSASRLSAGIGVAIIFHIALIWALMNGLAHKVMQVITEPIETRIVEEVKPPPPPKKVIELPPPPNFTPPPPVFVPLPEVQIQAPVAPPVTLSATTSVPVTSPRVEAPVSAPPKLAAPAPKLSAAVACSNYSSIMGQASFPRAAARLGLEEGDALIQFTLGANGEVKDVKALHASHPAFAENSIRLVSAYKCTGRGTDVLVQVPFSYKSE